VISLRNPINLSKMGKMSSFTATILILSERGGFFTGSGEFIRRANKVPGEAREE